MVDDGIDAARPRVTFPDPQLVAQVAAVEAVLPTVVTVFSWVRSIAFAVLFALAGSVVYAAIAKATEGKWGLVSILIGILAGLGAMRGGRGRKAQIVGAVTAAVAYFAAQVMAIVLIVGWDMFSALTAAQFGDVLKTIAHATFTTMDALFLGIVVYQGWVIPRARDV